MGGNQLKLLSHIVVFLAPFLSLSISNEKGSSGEDDKKKAKPIRTFKYL